VVDPSTRRSSTLWGTPTKYSFSTTTTSLALFSFCSFARDTALALLLVVLICYSSPPVQFVQVGTNVVFEEVGVNPAIDTFLTPGQSYVRLRVPHAPAHEALLFPPRTRHAFFDHKPNLCPTNLERKNLSGTCRFSSQAPGTRTKLTVPCVSP
jgi:hypothetical protein